MGQARILDFPDIASEGNPGQWRQDRTCLAERPFPGIGNAVLEENSEIPAEDHPPCLTMSRQ